MPVVGYQNLSTEQGFNFTVPTFKAVGDKAIDIQDIQLNFGEGEASGGDNIQILGTGGEMLEQYYWLPKMYMEGADKDGWANSETFRLAEKTINDGEGFLVDIVDPSTTKIVYSGEVSKEKTEISNTIMGFNWTGNNAPRTIDIQDIQLNFGEGEASGGDNIQILGTGGEMLEQYYWLPKMYMEGADKDGWANSETFRLAERELTAGQGFLIDIVIPSTKIILPEGFVEKKN